MALETTTDTGAWDEAPVTHEVIGGWDQPTDSGITPLESSWENVTAAEATPALAHEPPKPSLKPDGTRSWASIFNKPTPAPVQKKAPQPPPVHEEPAGESYQEEQPTSVAEDMPGLPPPVPIDDAGPDSASTPLASAITPSEPALEITPSRIS